MSTTWKDIAALIDYVDLRVDTQERDLRLLILEAEKSGVSTVVVNPVNVSLTAQLAKRSRVKVAAAVSYPVGAYWADEKGLEVADAVADGADEIYMVMAVGRFLDGKVREQTVPEMAALVKQAQGRPTKLVTELSVLTDDQKRQVCKLAVDAGIDYLVTSTNFAASKLPPVTLAAIQVLAEAAGDSIGIVYMGDVEQAQQVDELREAGVARFATTTIHLLRESYQEVIQ